MTTGTPREPEPPRRLLENRTLREQAFEHLREEILSNRLEPGAELNEVPLAKAFGTSRGPLREALGRLAAEGLVTIVPRRGAVVSRLTRQEFLDAYRVRQALEALAVRLAVPRLTPEDLADFRAMLDEMVRHADAGDEDQFFEVNGRFHERLVALSGNEKLREIHRVLTGQMRRMLSTSLALRGTVQRSIDEHRAILEAAEAGDPERAARLLEEHVAVPIRLLESAPPDEPEEGVH